MRTATKILTSVNIDERKNLDMKPGDTVRVHQKIKEKDGKTRIQVFEGMILARKHGTEMGGTFTVRRVAGGYGVEKIFPLYSPNIDKVEITRRAKVRRAKLYYVRKKAVKELSKRMKMELMQAEKESQKEVAAVSTAEGESHPENKSE